MGDNIVELKELFHGTEKQRGIKFIDNKSMVESLGDKHWLGDGAYFYEQLFFTYRWIKDMFKSRQKRDHKDFDELIDKYIILKGNIKADEKRIFDLNDNFEHKCIFDHFSKRIEENKKYSERFNKIDIADGVVLNVMFSEYNYIDKYDLVVASFETKKANYKCNDKTRLKYVLEKQICVKNIKVVYDISEKNFRADYDNLNYLINEYNKHNQMNIYLNKRKNYSKKQLF